MIFWLYISHYFWFVWMFTYETNFHFVCIIFFNLSDQGNEVIRLSFPYFSIFDVVQLLNHVQLCHLIDYSTPGSIISEFVQINVHWVSDAIYKCLFLCHALLLLPSIFPSIRVFSSESALRIWWPKYWSFSFRISPSNEYLGLISFRIDWFDLAVQGDSQESSPAPQCKSINSSVLGLLSDPTLISIHDYWKNHSLDL